MRPMTIAMIGQRGVPATFGGIERHVEELGARLAEKGHEVIVFSRRNYTDGKLRTFRGMKIVTLPTVGTKHLDAIVHSFLSTLWATSMKPDIVHFHALGPGLMSPLARSLGSARIVQTIHGIDGERAKWGFVAKRVLNKAGDFSKKYPDEVITVSRSLEDRYRREGRPATYICNGVALAGDAGGGPPPFGLERNKYVLFVGRLVPEKAPDLLLKAFRALSTDQKLVLAGDTSFSGEYVSRIQDLAALDDRVMLPGYVYGESLESLYRGASAFVLPSALEGLPLTLLEAAARGIPVIASDIEPHVEVLGKTGAGRRLFTSGDQQELTRALQLTLSDPTNEQAGALRFSSRVQEQYNWDKAADDTEALYARLISRGDRRRKHLTSSYSEGPPHD